MMMRGGIVQQNLGGAAKEIANPQQGVNKALITIPETAIGEGVGSR